MFRLHFYFGFLFSLVLVWAGCGKSGNERPIGTPTEGMQRIASKNAEFGWKLFQTTTAGGNDQNVLISPLSVHLALAMAVNGASGNTRQEMLQALHSADYLITDAMNKDWQDLMDLLTRQSGHPSVTLRNAFFYDPARLRLENAFREKLAEFYTAHIAQDNFNQAEGARDRINSWVKESTKGKIDKVVEDIKPEDLAFLVNALHFKADWSVAFDVQASSEGDFRPSASEKQTVTYMTGDRDFNTYRDSRLEAVDLPFRDSTYSLTLLMGRNAADFQTQWIGNTEWSEIKSIWQKMGYGRALVQLPRMQLQYEQQMIPLLQNLGMQEAFTPGVASFDALGRSLTGPDIYISSVFHKAVLEVDEKGAEGAAITSITFSTTSLPPVFTFNRPYVVLLRHIPTNTLLFAGKVVQPQ
jgi:serine protease inhibitor